MKENLKIVNEVAIKRKLVYLWIIGILPMLIELFIEGLFLDIINKAINDFENGFYWAKLFLGLVVVQTVSFAIMNAVQRRTRFRTYIEFLNLFSKKILESDINLFQKYNPGEIHLGFSDINKLSDIVGDSFWVIRQIGTIVISIYFIGKIDIRFVVPICFAYSLIGLIMSMQTRKFLLLDSEQDENIRKRNKEIDEIINGFALVRSTSGTKEKHSKSIKNSNEKIDLLNRKKIMLRSKFNAAISMFDSSVTFAALLFIILGLQNGTWNSLRSTGITLIVYLWRLIDPVISLEEYAVTFSEYKVPLKRIFNILKFENQIEDGTIELDSFDSAIKLDKVDFSYEKSSQILQNVTLKIKKGQKVGICGPSGEGKSTIIKLLTRLYDTTGGTITIDGIDIKDLKRESLMSHIGVVYQDTFIFDGSLYDNITYGCSRKCTGEEVYEACKKASLYDFVMSLDDKIDTNVGPRGLKLSGGQKQRISLARVFLSNPDIIILDEATSALDNETERCVKNAIAMMDGKTVVAVAHRLTTIQDFDRIVVINNHQIAEEGTHDSLMKKQGLYYNMINTKS